MICHIVDYCLSEQRTIWKQFLRIAPDSSSESKAEMAFCCDYVAPDYWYDNDFTKQDEPYQDVINGKWVYCYDIRNINRFADYACLNNLGRFDIFHEEEEYKAKVIEHIKTLPDNTIFFFQDSHF